jgi:teichuronic acid biosynthesis glycosyltransferase TuaC
MTTSKKVKLAVVTPFFPLGTQPYRGRSTYQLLRAMRTHFDIHVVCPITRYPKMFKPRRFDYRPVDWNYQLPDMNVQYLEYPGIPLLSRPLNGAICARYVEPVLRKIKPDVLLSYWIYPEGRGALLAARKVGIPVVVGAIGSDLNAIPDPISRILARRTMVEADHVITKSAALRMKAIEMGVPSKKITSISNGCDSELFRVGNREVARQVLNIISGKELVVFVGRLDIAKGIRELLEACLKLKAIRPALHLAMVGDGPLYEELKSFRHQHGEDWVTLASQCTPSEVSQWMTACDLLALPSYAEGCPNVVIEALSCGRPVVASAVGGIPELVSDSCGILVPPRQVEALVQAIDLALKRSWDERLIVSQFGRTWNEVAAEVETVLLKVLDRSVDLSIHSAAAELVSPPGQPQ